MIIDNKKVDLTHDEEQMYKDICASYTGNGVKGEDLFFDLFETDDNGIIVFLKPPSKRQTSFEVFLFLMSVMQNQHIRAQYKVLDEAVDEIKNKIKEIDEKLAKL